MQEPVWLREDLVYAIHARQLSEHRGPDGCRDAGLLSSALDRPKNLWGYSNPKPDLSALAATYAVGIVRNHPFVDGNKRTAYVVFRTFLLLNGRDIHASQEDKYSTFLAVAAGSVTEEGLVAWTRARIADRQLPE